MSELAANPATRSPETASPRLVRALAGAAIAGAAIFLVGLVVDPRRAWGGYLIGFACFTGLALSGGLFLSVLTLAGARWSAALRRVPEAMTTALPYALCLGLGLTFGIHHLYEWSHAAVVAEDPLLSGKRAYLNGPGYIVRMIAFFALWIWLARGMVLASRRRDADPDPRHGRALLRYALLFLPVFALTWSLASVDWLQSLEPHWFSTIYALLTLAGLASSGLGAGIVLVVLLRRQGALRGVVNASHLDDLGRIGIGFALFWGYVWYCQYMLVWYTNMPEETPWYVLRMQGGWRVLTWVSVGLNWALPFFLLMPRAVRRSETALLRVAWVLLAGQALHLFLLVAPPLMGDRPVVGAWELGPILGAYALFFWAALRGLRQAPIVATGDPDLTASLHHHV